MTTRDAILKRLNEICKDKKRTLSDICLAGGLNPSVVSEFKSGRTNVMKIDTAKRICMGAGITLAEFFTPEYFNDYEE